MSADVTLEVIRKSDSTPYETIYISGKYIGGNRARSNLYHITKEATVMGRSVYRFENKEEVLRILEENIFTYTDYDTDYDEFLSDLADYSDDEYLFFLQIDT